MLARLGNVIYWLGIGLAGLWMALAIFLERTAGTGSPPMSTGEALAIVCIPAAGLWLIGRAAKYVLAGQ